MTIEGVIQAYFKGYLTADSGLVAQAFDPETRLLCIDDGKLEKTELAAWLRNLDDRKARGDVRTADQQIVSVDVQDTTAIAKVVLTFPKFRFTDYLSLLRIEGEWRIVGKIYSVASLP